MASLRGFHQVLSLHQLYVQKLGKRQHGYYNDLVLSVSLLNLGISLFSCIYLVFVLNVTGFSQMFGDP